MKKLINTGLFFTFSHDQQGTLYNPRSILEYLFKNFLSAHEDSTTCFSNRNCEILDKEGGLLGCSKIKREVVMDTKRYYFLALTSAMGIQPIQASDEPGCLSCFGSSEAQTTDLVIYDSNKRHILTLVEYLTEKTNPLTDHPMQRGGSLFGFGNVETVKNPEIICQADTTIKTTADCITMAMGDVDMLFFKPTPEDLTIIFSSNDSFCTIIFGDCDKHILALGQTKALDDIRNKNYENAHTIHEEAHELDFIARWKAFHSDSQ